MEYSHGMRAVFIAVGLALGGSGFCSAASCDVCVVGGGVAGVTAAALCGAQGVRRAAGAAR